MTTRSNWHPLHPNSDTHVPRHGLEMLKAIKLHNSKYFAIYRRFYRNIGTVEIFWSDLGLNEKRVVSYWSLHALLTFGKLSASLLAVPPHWDKEKFNDLFTDGKFLCSINIAYQLFLQGIETNFSNLLKIFKSTKIDVSQKTTSRDKNQNNTQKIHLNSILTWQHIILLLVWIDNRRSWQ